MDWTRLEGSDLWRAAADRYDDNGHAYHNMTHVGRLYGHAARLRLPYDLSLDRAILAHDVILDGDGANEARSSVWLTERLEMPDRLSTQMIMTTVDHDPQHADRRLAILDLADFMDPDQADMNTDLLRLEAMRMRGSEFDEDAWAAGTAGYLGGLQERIASGQHIVPGKPERRLWTKISRGIGRTLNRLAEMEGLDNGADLEPYPMKTNFPTLRGCPSEPTASPAPVSIVIPLYQKERHIRAALDSAAESCTLAGCDFELVVVDDGSTDGSVLAVLDWADDNPDMEDRVNLIHLDNSGAAIARNIGWRAARFENILFLDADDRWMPGHVGQILDLMRDFPEATLYADAWDEISPAGEKRTHNFGIGSERRGYLPCFFEAMSSGPMIASSSTAATRVTHLAQSGGFPEGITHGEDKVGWGRLALLGRMAWTPAAGAVWDKSADNRSDPGTSTPSSAFRDFLEDAQDTTGLADQVRENIAVAMAVEDARIAGEIRFYDHGTPEKFRKTIEAEPDGPTLTL